MRYDRRSGVIFFGLAALGLGVYLSRKNDGSPTAVVDGSPQIAPNVRTKDILEAAVDRPPIGITAGGGGMPPGMHSFMGGDGGGVY